MKQLVAAAVFAFAALLSICALVMGHAALQSSDPANGATIKTPYTLTATYDEELTPNGSSIVIQSSTGAAVAHGTVSDSDAKVMTVDLPALPDGQYTVAWTAVTADDNGVTRGTYSFIVAAAPPSTAPSAAVATAASSAPATPAPSAATGQSPTSGALVAVGVAVVISVAVLFYFLYRNRRG